ncbi:Dimeric dUTPase [hydrothermal vent metagenome]|uniref:Dimeric dUTPase n=1 Tax=hydrothermal vent metagenome TaxID=652676 RepID=A0A1W1C8P4_9ZZZZ
MNKIREMLLLQQQLNDNTNGIGWESGVTKNGKIIDWRRCSYLECAELIESYPWKHWKNIDASPDYDNIKIEAVDIWHFIMSQALQEYKVNNLGDIDQLSEMITSLPEYQIFTEGIRADSSDYYEEIKVVESLMKSLFCDESIDKLMASFFRVALQSGLNLDKLYQLYIGKNILNSFRQDHGYKDGTYIKIWSGQEDNQYMQKILESNSTIKPKELYLELEKRYSEID